MQKRYVCLLCAVFGLIALGFCGGSRSSAFENEEFRIIGTINGQDIDNVFNPATAIRIDLSAPITFNITFEVLTTSNITLDSLGITIRIFGFDMMTITLPVDQTITGGTTANFSDSIDFGEFLTVGDGFSIISGTYDIGVSAQYTIVDTGEEKEIARDIYFNIDAPIYASITGLASLGGVGLVGGKTLLSRPKSIMGATTFGASSSGSGYFVGQQMGWLSFDLTAMILTIVAVCVACGLVGYMIIRRRKRVECLVKDGTTYCRKDVIPQGTQPRRPSKRVELNIDHLTDFITQPYEKE